MDREEEQIQSVTRSAPTSKVTENSEDISASNRCLPKMKLKMNFLTVTTARRWIESLKTIHSGIVFGANDSKKLEC